jgi:hypothetical protein
VRAMIRDIIADRVGELIQSGVAAAAAAGPTAGASVATFLTGAIARAAQTAAENARRVADLLDRLSSGADQFSEVIRRFGAIADDVRSGLGRIDAAPRLHGEFLAAPHAIRSPAGRFGAFPRDVLESDATAGVVELGKQREEADQRAGSWERDAD